MRLLLTLILCLSFLACTAQLPKGFTYAKELIPGLKSELRYYNGNNFIGKPIDGYLSDKIILTTEAARALAKVQAELETFGLSLKVFDAYRPQRAVNHFIRWARVLNDTVNKSRFYPDVKKRHLFREGYIATRSGHSRGSTLDLTIVDLKTGEELDMGSPYDFFGMESWVNYGKISASQRANRMLLQAVMLKHGFRNYPKEWWHFTLRNEPYPETYFDFEVE